jgi:hypothetical protein
MTERLLFIDPLTGRITIMRFFEIYISSQTWLLLPDKGVKKRVRHVSHMGEKCVRNSRRTACRKDIVEKILA